MAGEAVGGQSGRAMSSVLGVALLGGLGYGLIFPVAALYGESAGLTAAQITLLIALHPLMRLISGPFWGAAADRLGRRPVLLAGVALQLAGNLIFGLAGGGLGLGLGRLLTGLGSGEAVAAMAVVADLTSHEDRAKGLGQIRAATGLGMLIGPVLGGVLGLVDLSLPGLGAAFFSTVALLAVWRWLPETRGTRVEEKAERVAVLSLVPARALIIAGAAAASLALAESIVPLAVEHVLVPRLDRGADAAFWLAWVADWTDGQIALLLTVGVILAWGMTTVLFDGFLSARIVGRLGEKRTLKLGLALWALAFFATPPVYRAGVLPGGLAVALTAMPVSLTGVSLATWLSRRAGPQHQGRVNGAAQAAIAMGEFLGPAMSGALFGVYYGLPYQVGAVVLVVMFGLAWRL